MLAPTYSCIATTIGSTGLNCRVRNENGCDPGDKALAHNIRYSIFKFQKDPHVVDTRRARINPARWQPKLLSRTIIKNSERKHFFRVSPRMFRVLPRFGDSHNSFREFCRQISTPRLNTLLCFHLAPINVVISHEPQTIPYLGVGFPLRCFQRLSFPDIATRRCHWRDSR